MKAPVLTCAAAALCFFSFSEASAQSSTTTTRIPTYIGTLSSESGSTFGNFRTVDLNSADTNAPTVVGNTFLTDNWCAGSIYIAPNQLLETPKFKYDIENNQILLNTSTKKPKPDQADNPEDLRVINGVQVLAFEINDPVQGKRGFVSSINSGYTLQGAPAPGFLEVLADGNMYLYRKVETSLLKANYNIALNAGEKRDRIVKREVYFLRKDGSKELIPVSRNKKETLAAFDKQAQVEKFATDNKVKFNNADDLTQLVTYYNSLQ
ncbi:hypothetical protein [Pontibacter ruber]|uniref:Uncharacterized protein n=1 Tax=Pontibacter ruber TaxID=1343895 RepID=A0ABW5CUC6_9BACT|nr:hypothetical protein [Pontibacter ruber]